MARRDFFALVIAIGSGLIAFLLFLNLSKNNSEIRTVQFVMTSSAVYSGEILSENHLTLSEPVKTDGETEKKYFLNIMDVVGREAVRDIPAGETIERAMVTFPKPKAQQQVVQQPTKRTIPIPPGTKALNIKSGDIENIPAILNGGDYVDIIGWADSSTGKEIKTILQGVQVISVDQNDEQQTEAVNFALRPREVETLLNATAQGKIRLLIRSDGERGPAVVTGAVEVYRGIQKGETQKFTT